MNDPLQEVGCGISLGPCSLLGRAQEVARTLEEQEQQRLATSAQGTSSMGTVRAGHCPDNSLVEACHRHLYT